jgi:hypothetical protein
MTMARGSESGLTVCCAGRCCGNRPFVKTASIVILTFTHTSCNTNCGHACSLIPAKLHPFSQCSMVSMTPKTDAPTTSLTANNSNRGGRCGMFTRRPGRQKLAGLFADGTWHCDCDYSPRLPAQRFRVVKESPNKGEASSCSCEWHS